MRIRPTDGFLSRAHALTTARWSRRTRFVLGRFDGPAHQDGGEGGTRTKYLFRGRRGRDSNPRAFWAKVFQERTDVSNGSPLLGDVPFELHFCSYRLSGVAEICRDL